MRLTMVKARSGKTTKVTIEGNLYPTCWYIWHVRTKLIIQRKFFLGLHQCKRKFLGAKFFVCFSFFLFYLANDPVFDCIRIFYFSIYQTQSTPGSTNDMAMFQLIRYVLMMMNELHQVYRLVLEVDRCFAIFLIWKFGLSNLLILSTISLTSTVASFCNHYIAEYGVLVNRKGIF